MTRGIFGKSNIFRNTKYEILRLLNKKIKIIQKKSIETIRSLVITLADLKDQSRFKNIRLNKKG